MNDRSHEGTSRLDPVPRLPRRRRHGLDDRHRLPGQDALVALALVDVEQTQVGRNQGSDAERHHVARHEVRDGNPTCLAVPPNLCLLSDLSPKRSHGYFRPVFVEEPEADAEEDDHGDDDRIGASAGEPRHERRPEQKEQDRVPNLAKEDRRRTHTMNGQRIRAKPTKSLLDLVGCEPFRAATKSGEDFLRRERCSAGEIQFCCRGPNGKGHSVSLVVGTRRRQNRLPDDPRDARESRRTR